MRMLNTRMEEIFDLLHADHAASVGSGAMPLALLEKHVDWYMSQE